MRNLHLAWACCAIGILCALFHLADALRNKRFLACDAMARAARLKGNALRLEGDLEAADGALALGLMYLGDASPERPWFLRSLGILRWEQDRLAEGLGLLEHAARLSSPNQVDRLQWKRSGRSRST